MFLFISIVTLISGAGGTGLGGVVGALFHTDSNRVVSLLLAFAGGVMTAIVCFDLLTESVEAAQTVTNFGVFVVIVAVLAGVAVVYGLNHVIDRRTSSEVNHTAAKKHPKTHDNIDELVHADHWAEHHRHHSPRPQLMVAGIVMACAIALHNIPEGMTIGAGFAIEDEAVMNSGMILAVLIGIHNIPEGMAVAVPLISGGMSKIRAILLTAASGLPTLLGAWLGFWLGDIGPIGLALSLGFASGAMLYVVFGEIIPESVLIYKSKAPSFAVIVGMLLGLVLIFS